MPEDAKTEGTESPFARYTNIIKALNAARANGTLTDSQYVELCAEADGCRVAEEAPDGGGQRIGEYVRGSEMDRLRGEEYMTRRNNFFLDGFGLKREELGGKTIQCNIFGLPDIARIPQEELTFARNVTLSFADAVRAGR